MLPWQAELTEVITTGRHSVILLHGAIRDIFLSPEAKPAAKSTGADSPGNEAGSSGGDTPAGEYVNLGNYLYKDVFSGKDYFIEYDPARGIDFPDKDQKREFLRTIEAYDSIHNTKHSSNIPKNPGNAFLFLENFARLQASQNKSAVIVIDYLEDILPAGDRSYLSNELRYCLVAIDKWSRDPFFLRKDITFILTIENLALLDAKITRNASVPKIELLLPERKDRLMFLQKLNSEDQSALELKPEAAAALTSGLSLSQLEKIVTRARKSGKKIDSNYLKERKKEAIEAECLGLLEFVEPKTTLEHVAGHNEAKHKLRQAARAVQSGHSDILPMGYLISGPVGTGKTFLVTSFAGEIGIPVVQLMNFRSQWVGATEANLEKILNLLKSMWPVAVIIDEADAFLGQRSASGDSGTSSRVFARLMSFMSNTEYRGRILWFLITCRPDLLPIDAKRQGRAEEHFALFYPHTAEDKQAIFEAMCRKNNIDPAALPPYSEIFDNAVKYSGAEMESILTRARFLQFADGKESLDAATLKEAVSDFIPPSYPEEIELQNLVAVKECTSRAMLPEHYRNLDNEELHRRIRSLSERQSC